MENRITQLRLEQGISQKALAEKAGVSKFYLNRIEKGEDINPSIMIIAKIANALDHKIEDLLAPNELPNRQTKEGGDDDDG